MHLVAIGGIDLPLALDPLDPGRLPGTSEALLVFTANAFALNDPSAKARGHSRR